MDTWSRKTDVHAAPKGRLRQFVEMLAVIVLAVVFLRACNLWKTPDSSVFSFEADSFCFAPCDGVTCTVPYGEIQALSLVDTPESFGECLIGEAQRNLVYGRWKTSGGEAMVYVLTAVPKAIMLETAEETLIFNYTDEKNTESFYTALCDMWQDTAPAASRSEQTGE